MHWPNNNEYQTLKAAGYDFAVVTFQPGDNTTAAARLNAAAQAGIKLIIGMYPEPYTYSGGRWTISSAGQSSLNFLESRQLEIMGLFVFNEPYWVDGYTAQQLRDLRTAIRVVWPGAPVYHDLGQPSCWRTGGLCDGGPAWDNQAGVCDLCGIWDYPFQSSGYQKTRALSALATETAFVANNIGGKSVWLNQSHSATCCGLVYPTDTQIRDWNCSARGAAPAGTHFSWYVWRQSIYPDYLANHSSQWPLTIASAC